MKKIYSLVCAVAFSSLSIAQTQKTFNTALASPAKKASFDRTALKAKVNPYANAKTAAGNAGWFNYGIAAEALYNVTSELNSNYLFPDSTALGDFGGTFAGAWVHHLAEVVDFNSPVFSMDANTSWVGTNMPASISIDSMSVLYAYTRSVTAVDTLVVTIYKAPKSGTGIVATSGFVSSNFLGGADTVSFKRLGYDQALNVIAAQSNTATAIPNKMVVKIPLTGADTAITSYREKTFALPTAYVMSGTGNELIVGSVMFKPGYAYNAGDHIDDLNAFFFTSLEEQGASTYMTFNDCNYGFTACDYSQSHILPQDVRYNNAASWNGRFIPAMAYTQPYGFEHHLISFHVTDDIPSGIKQNTVNGATLGQNVPNPYKGESTVNYNLTKDVKSAIFTVTDVMGRVISSQAVETTTGNHTVKLGAYAAGVYYYSLNVDGHSITKKMIVE